jgi:1-acyl-sn-glycerol-3-phosphate acyltransferase
MRRRVILKPHPLVVPLIRTFVLRFLKRRYRLSAVEESRVQGLKPPFIVVSNHVNFWDPFWINTFLAAPIQFVASDNLFRTTLFGLAMRLLGAIPKTKLMNDSQTIGHIFRVLGAGGVVGIFPEGSRSYDGRSEPAQFAVARLIRKMKLPVVSALIEGGYLARPRWARSVRLGSVRLRYRLLFSGQDLAGRSDEDVYRTLSGALRFDEMAVQREKKVSFPTRRPAEYLERLLFMCPHCRSVATLVSRARRFSCTHCGYAVRVNDIGFLVPDGGPLYFDDPAEWNSWQLGAFRDYLESGNGAHLHKLQQDDAVVLRGYRAYRLRRLARGRVRLFQDAVELHARGGLSLRFPLSSIRGANVQNGEKLELYCEGLLYRLDFSDPRVSSYMWLKAIEILQSGDTAAQRDAASL